MATQASNFHIDSWATDGSASWIQTVAPDLSTQYHHLAAPVGYVKYEINRLIDDAPGALDTIRELGEAFKNADSSLQSFVQTQISTLHVMDISFGNALNAEISRATAAEGTIANNLAQEILDRDAGDSTLQSNLDDEISRATAAEGVIASNLAQEILDRDAGDSTLQSNLDDEISRATAAEGVIASNLAQEILDRDAGDSTLQSNLDDEISRATAAEGVIASNLAQEILDRSIRR